MASSHSYEPPKFITDASGYPEYKRKLERWSRITKVDKTKQAEVVLYHLEGHASNIQEKIDTALGDEIIDKEDGMTKLIAYLDTIYAEDEMADAWFKYKRFVKLRKTEEQPVNEFIAEFEKMYAKAKESGCEFSDTVLAFNLLEACNLSEMDEKFILTAVNFSVGKEKKDLLEQVKSSLRKFQSRGKFYTEYKVDKMKIEKEELFLTSIKETLLTEGWKPPSVGKQHNYRGKKNALGADGKPLKCFECQSEYHLLDKCELRVARGKKNKKINDDKKKETSTMLSTLLKEKKVEFAMVNATLGESDNKVVLVSKKEEELCCLIEEAGCMGVLDSACSRSVAGIQWVAKYTKQLPSHVASSLEVTYSDKVYQFGGGEKRKSCGSIALPTLIGERKVFVGIDIVDAEIPLLIGSNSMEAAGAVLDFQRMLAVFFEQEVPMIKVGTGHVCIQLFSEYLETHINCVDDRDKAVEDVLIEMADVNINKIKKLHHIYGHTSAGKITKFLKNAGHDIEGVKDALTELEKSCDACNKTKKRVPRPKSSIPRAEYPNQIVTVDLKVYGEQDGKKRYICYLIDMFSRLTVGQFTSDKNPESIVKVIVQHWIPVYGVMGGLHSDIGGEMSNELLHDVASKLGIEVTTTSSYSPHQNGINERNHSVVDLMLARMMLSDPSIPPEMALCWSLHAKNSLENVYGYSSFQLHVGQNPKLPSVTRDGPPAYDNYTKSKCFADNLNAMHLAREEFIKAESSLSLKKALRSKVHPRGEGIVEGDMIYYKKNNGISGKRLWSGPSKVVSTNGKKLFIDQGARLGTVCRDDAVIVGKEFWRMDNMENENATQEEDDSISPHVFNQSSTDSDSHEHDFADETPAEVNNDDQENTTKEVGVHTENVQFHPNFSHKDIRKDDWIRYSVDDASEKEIVKVVSRGGKASGSNKFWWNVKVDGTGELKSVNTEVLKNLDKVCHVNDEHAVDALVVTIPRSMHNEPECIKAKEKELDNWDTFGTFTEVQDIGQTTLRTNWILVRKDGVKARLCIRGDLEDTEDVRIDSPTVNKMNIKLFYLLALHFGWNIRTADVKAAFLQGSNIDRDVFVKPPKERRVPGIIWKMLKRAYGFVDASRGFYLELERILVSLGCKVSQYDQAMYVYYNENDQLDGLILTHVDDLLYGFGSDKFIEDVLIPLKEALLFGREAAESFAYVGMYIRQENGAIYADQDQYVDSIEIPEYTYDNKTLDNVLGSDSQTDFRALVGKISWVAWASRPDLSYDALVLSTRYGKATHRDMKEAVKILRKMKCDMTYMKFADLGPVTEWSLKGYGDAAFKSLPDKVSSCGGHVILACNELKKVSCVLSWKSKKLRRIVSSSTAAELLEANTTVDALVYTKSVLIELLGSEAIEIPLYLFTDSRNLHKSVLSTTPVENLRERIEIARLQESLKVGELKEFYEVSSKDMLADCLTKKGAPCFQLMNILRTCKD